MSEIRLSKLMAQLGLCSRREADYYIEHGWVRVDDVIVNKLGSKVEPHQRISLEPQAQRQQSQLVTVLINKPLGYVSAQAEKGYRPAVSLIIAHNHFSKKMKPPKRNGLAPAGRLDIDSCGLLVLTQDGRIARQLVGATSRIEKEYLVHVQGEITPHRLEQLRCGLVLDQKPLRPANIEQLNGQQLRFVLQEGRKRQIRRMCDLVGLTVTRLLRIRIGGVKLGRLPPSKWRFLRSDELF